MLHERWRLVTLLCIAHEAEADEAVAVGRVEGMSGSGAGETDRVRPGATAQDAPGGGIFAPGETAPFALDFEGGERPFPDVAGHIHDTVGGGGEGSVLPDGGGCAEGGRTRPIFGFVDVGIARSIAVAPREDPGLFAAGGFFPFYFGGQAHGITERGGEPAAIGHGGVPGDGVARVVGDGEELGIDGAVVAGFPPLVVVEAASVDERLELTVGNGVRTDFEGRQGDGLRGQRLVRVGVAAEGNGGALLVGAGNFAPEGGGERWEFGLHVAYCVVRKRHQRCTRRTQRIKKDRRGVKRWDDRPVAGAC